jgi:hypothetical protein
MALDGFSGTLFVTPNRFPGVSVLISEAVAADSGVVAGTSVDSVVTNAGEASIAVKSYVNIRGPPVMWPVTRVWVVAYCFCLLFLLSIGVPSWKQSTHSQLPRLGSCWGWEWAGVGHCWECCCQQDWRSLEAIW